MAITRISLVRLLQLALTVACLGMHFKDYKPPSEVENMVVTGTFAGYFIIIIGTFAGAVMGDSVTKRVGIFYSLAGCALFIAAGSLCIKYYDQYTAGETRHIGLAKGSLAIINGAIFLLDSFLTYRGE